MSLAGRPEPGGHTLMVVHAHPDDESSQTGGTLARYAAEGWRTVLVTCTNGNEGDAENGAKPGESGHDPAAVAMRRSRELAQAATTLGVTDLIELGHRDSGFGNSGDSPAKAHTNEVRFTDLPFDAVLLQIEALMWCYRPDVVVTYPPNGLSGHPDHIRVHDLTIAAHSQVVSQVNYPEWTRAKALAGTASTLPALYYIAVSKSELAAIRDRARLALGPETWLPPEELAVPDTTITTEIDVTPYWEEKLKALGSHSSQADARMLLEVFRAGTGTVPRIEQYTRTYPPLMPSPTGLPERAFSRVVAFSG